MSLLCDTFSIGVLQVTVYTFEKIGDTLPKHNHTEATAHITICARGKVRMITPIETRVLSAGQAVDTPAGTEHEFTAEEDDSRIFNIVKNPNGSNPSS